MSNIFKYVQLALASVLAVEATMEQDSGASKQQRALDLINVGAQVAGVTVPKYAGLSQAIVNIAVASFNLAGLFTHKTSVQPAP